MLKQKISTALTIEEFFKNRKRDEQSDFLVRMVKAWREEGYSEEFILELLHGHDDFLSGHMDTATRH